MQLGLPIGVIRTTRFAYWNYVTLHADTTAPQRRKQAEDDFVYTWSDWKEPLMAVPLAGGPPHAPMGSQATLSHKRDLGPPTPRWGPHGSL